jgi:hypothetical protein
VGRYLQLGSASATHPNQYGYAITTIALPIGFENNDSCMIEGVDRSIGLSAGKSLIDSSQTQNSPASTPVATQNALLFIKN